MSLPSSRVRFLEILCIATQLLCPLSVGLDEMMVLPERYCGPLLVLGDEAGGDGDVGAVPG